MVIRAFTSQDVSLFPEALELLNRTQGRDLFKPQYFDQRTADPLTRIFAAFENEKLIGLGVVQIINEFSFYKQFDPDLPAKFADRTVGQFSTLAVTETHQGRGVGQRISAERLKWLKEKNADVIIGVSWVSGFKNTSDRVFEKMGFQAVKKIDNFFLDFSNEKPFVCPACGGPPCTCSAIFYKLEL